MYLPVSWKSPQENLDIGVLFGVTHCDVLNLDKEPIMDTQSVGTLTSWIEYWNRKVERFTIWDVKLVQLSSAAWVLILVKIFPQIMQVSIWWFVLIVLLCAPRLLVVLFRKDR